MFLSASPFGQRKQRKDCCLAFCFSSAFTAIAVESLFVLSLCFLNLLFHREKTKLVLIWGHDLTFAEVCEGKVNLLSDSTAYKIFENELFPLDYKSDFVVQKSF